jgi:hypothetical protein
MPQLKLSRSLDETAPWKGEVDSLYEAPMSPCVTRLQVQGEQPRSGVRAEAPVEHSELQAAQAAPSPPSSQRERRSHPYPSKQGGGASPLARAVGLTGIQPHTMKQMKKIWAAATATSVPQA